MNNKELALFVSGKVAERKELALKIKADIEELLTLVRADLKAVGESLDSIEEVGDIVIDILDAETNTGWLEPFDSFVAKAQFRKLLKVSWGIKISNWFKSLGK